MLMLGRIATKAMIMNDYEDEDDDNEEIIRMKVMIRKVIART